MIHDAMTNYDAATERNKAVVQQLFDRVWNQRDVDFADEIVVKDVIDHNPAPGAAPGIEGLKERVRLDDAAFTDYRMYVDSMIGEGDLVAVRLSWTGTHTGTFGPFEATGRPVKGSGITIFRFKDGKIVERWAALDAIGLLRQMGVIPEPMPGSPL